MLKMVFSLFIASLALPLQSFDCSKNIKFSRDCQIQKDFQSLKDSFNELGVEINYLKRYRALRFIDLNTYLYKRKDRLEDAYDQQDKELLHINPWERWTSTARIIERDYSLASFDENSLREIHALSMNPNFPNSSNLMPSLFRTDWKKSVGFIACEKGQGFKSCMDEWRTIQRDVWLSGDLGPRLRLKKKDGSVRYPHRSTVPTLMKDWFIQLDEFKARVDQEELAPVEAALTLQRELSAIHPFRDGNGRVTRFFQDLFMLEYNLPFIPSGYLIDDHTTLKDKYIELGYESLEKELSLLKLCLTEHQEQKEISHDCRVIQ